MGVDPGVDLRYLVRAVRHFLEVFRTETEIAVGALVVRFLKDSEGGLLCVVEERIRVYRVVVRPEGEWVVIHREVKWVFVFEEAGETNVVFVRELVSGMTKGGLDGDQAVRFAEGNVRH